MGQQRNPSVICCLLGITMFAILANGCAPEANDEGSQPIVAVGPITTSANSGQHNDATNHTDVTSEIPRPAMPDEVVTAEELAAAFDHTAGQNLLRVRGVTVSLGPGSDSEILEREIVGSQNGDGIGARFRSNGARFVTRRVPPTTSDSVIKSSS